MSATTVVDAARRALGQVGVLLPVSHTSAPVRPSSARQVQRLEHAGDQGAWTSEVVGGKDAFVQPAVLLAATEWTGFGTAIANMWARPPQTAHGAAALLAQSFPGPFVLRLDAGYPPNRPALRERRSRSRCVSPWLPARTT